MSENGVIGRDGQVPWHLPDDMKHFKSLTTGHTVIMGRRTFESLKRPLPNRRNVVITTQPNYAPDGATVVHGLAQALTLAERDDEVFVAGGADIYRLALPHANRMYLTIVHAEVSGDTFFPDIEWDEWSLIDNQRREPDERHGYARSFRRYERKS